METKSLSRDVFKRMILSLEYPNEYNFGENQRADQMLSKWRYYYNNPSIFENKLTEVKKLN